MLSHLSDALRLAVVHKYSAIYADLDFIVSFLILPVSAFSIGLCHLKLPQILRFFVPSINYSNTRDSWPEKSRTVWPKAWSDSLH